jgi:GT2 family glycosyltransferase/uncharacterized coiled-coil protein SlyX
MPPDKNMQNVTVLAESVRAERDALERKLAENTREIAELRLKSARKQMELDALQHQANLLAARLAAVEHRLYGPGLWQRARRFVGGLFRAARRAIKFVLVRLVNRWPGSTETKRMRIDWLRELNNCRNTGANVGACFTDVCELAEGRWPAQPAYRAQAALVELPAIDISVVVYDSERWIDGFMTSLLAVEYPLEKITLLVRDHSPGPGTRKGLEAFFAGRENPLAAYQYSAGKNAGFGAGHNHNFKLGRASHFLVCNVDGRFQAETLRALLGAATASAESIAAWELRQVPYEHPKYYDPVTMLTTWVSGACVLFRRDAYQQVGGFDDRIFMYGEDVDLSYRLRGRGYQLAYVPQAMFRHDTYSEPAQFKPLQFHGSSLANALLRLRFGTLGDMLALPGMWRELARSAWQQHAFAGFLRNTIKLFLLGPVFLLTRNRRGNARIPFLRWDYGLRREGAFESVRPIALEPPLVSIIVRTYAGREHLLRQALVSIANQTYKHVEVLVVEDKGAQMRGFAEQCPREFGLDIKYISSTMPGSNRCVTGNIGLAAARGEFVNFLDDDDLFFADHVEYLVSRLAPRPELGACYSLSWETKTRIDAQTGRYVETTHSSLPGQRIRFDRRELQRANYIPIQSVLFRRELFELYGGFNEALENLEDWNLWRRYSWRHDFEMCAKTTSLYHIPGDLEVQASRQSLLDVYYDVAKHASDLACAQIDRRVISIEQDG